MEYKKLQNILIENISISINAKLKQIPLVINILEDFTFGIPSNILKLENINLCIETILENIIINGYKENNIDSISIDFEKHSKYLKIIIQEKGMPYNFNALLYSCNKTLLKKFTHSFRNCEIKNYVDNIYFDNLGVNGRKITIIKSYDEFIENDYNTISNSSKSLNIDNKNYIVRRMHSDEALEVSRCAYSSYGYSYMDEDIYYPDKIENLNNTNKLISYVAVTDNNKIISHVGLKPNNDSGELLAAFTHPKYRGLNCLNKIVENLICECKSLNLTGVYVNAVCVHTYSQKSAHNYNFKDCALFLCKIKSLDFKNFEVNSSYRDNLLMSYKYLKTNFKLKLYICKHHMKIIKEIYSQFNIDVTFIDSKISHIKNTPCKYTLNFDSMDSASIHINSYGKNLIECLHKETKKLCCNKVEVIYLYLDLENPDAPLYVKDLENIGFFFAGVIPGDVGNNKLVLQYLNNILIDYSSIKTESEIGNKILNYVMNSDPNINIIKENIN